MILTVSDHNGEQV